MQPQQQVTTTDLLVKIGSLTIELDLARQRIAVLEQRHADLNGGAPEANGSQHEHELASPTPG